MHPCHLHILCLRLAVFILLVYSCAYHLLFLQLIDRAALLTTQSGTPGLSTVQCTHMHTQMVDASKGPCLRQLYLPCLKSDGDTRFGVWINLNSPSSIWYSVAGSRCGVFFYSSSPLLMHRLCTSTNLHLSLSNQTKRESRAQCKGKVWCTGGVASVELSYCTPFVEHSQRLKAQLCTLQ